MFSDRTRVALSILALALPASGCGHKAPPVPPPLKNPANTTDLTVLQRGETAALAFTYPQTTVSGLPMAELEKVEIWKLRKPAPPPLASALDEGEPEDGAPETEATTGSAAAEDAGADSETAATADEPDESEADSSAAGDETDARASRTSARDADDEDEDKDDAPPQRTLEQVAAVDALEFSSTAALVETLDGEELDNAIQGSKLYFLVELEEPSHEKWAYTFAVKTFGPGGIASRFSNLVTLVQRRPPPAPEDFAVEAEAGGIRISWRAPEAPDTVEEDAEDEEDDDKPSDRGFRVYRRSAASRSYAEPLARLTEDAEEHFDRSAVFGERYVYAVTAVAQKNPTVESFFAGEREVEYSDRFAPATPKNLIALAQEGRVRLLWDAGPERDLAGYVIFRRQGDAEFLRLNEQPVLASEYNDRTVAASTTFEYRVAAVDEVGNMSEPSAPVVARVP